MKKTHGLVWIISLLYLQTYKCLVSAEGVITKARMSVILPCGVNSPEGIDWKKNDKQILKYVKTQKITYGTNQEKQELSRFRVQNPSTNNLEISDVKVSDSGTYTCLKDKQIQTVQLLVLNVVATPSSSLLASETLTLTIETPPEMSFIVSWWKDKKKIGDGLSLKKYNVQIEDQGIYKWRVQMGNGPDKEFETNIEVRGFYTSPSIVYTSGKRPVTIPWTFNFDVRRTPLEKEARALEGNITYSSQMIKPLTVENGAACWQKTCETKPPEGHYDNLSFYHNKPKSGTYQMEIVLLLQNRQRHLSWEVCVANLTVAVLESIITMESNVTLQCSINCLDKDRRLCWYYNVIGLEVCGTPGQKTFTKNFTAVKEMLGNWTCSVMIGKDIVISTNLTLEATPGFFHISNPVLWVTVTVIVLFFIFIVAIITVITARCRRMRRARHRAWLLENLHQKRVCECNGFAPKRLRENV